MKPTENKVPRHIGIILDGNRRFSKRLMIKPWKGHEWGAKKVESVLEWAKELGIKELTLYAFSLENLNRPKQEFDYLMNLFEKEFTRLKTDERIHKERIRINIIGRVYLFPKSLQKVLKEVMESTKDYDGLQVNFAMAYSGRAEIIDATRNIAEQIKSGKLDIEKINEETFSKNLYLNHDPDIIIRTGGERRTSNFLNYQGAYSELFFIDKMWPEFEKQDLIATIEEYNQRERRFGR